MAVSNKDKNPVINNKLAIELSGEGNEFIKQPYLYAMIGADFTLSQRGIMVEVMGNLQERFSAMLKAKKSSSGRQLSLFTEEELSKELITFKIDIASLGIKADAYDELEMACRNLLTLNMAIPDVDPDTGGMAWTYAVLFTEVTIPVDKNPDYKFKGKQRRKSYIRIKANVKALSQLCNLDNGLGYIDHIRRIARICKKKRTPSIYIYLSRWAKDFPFKSVEYMELKKFLGVIQPRKVKGDKGGRPMEVEKDLYPKFSMFCSLVLDPIKEELDQLAAENKVDFSFDYVPEYKNGKKRGNPEKIRFNIKLSGLGEQLYRKRKKLKAPSDVWDMLRAEYKLTDSDVKGLSEMLPDELVPLFRKEVVELKERMIKYAVKNGRAYAVASLKNFITQHTPGAEEIKEKEPVQDAGGAGEKSPSVPQISEEDKKRWKELMDVVSLNVTGMDFKTWFSPLGFISFKDNVLTLSVPNTFVKDYIEDNFLDVIRKAVTTAFGDVLLNYQPEKA